MIATDIPQALGVFGLCQILAFVEYLKSKLSERDFNTLFQALLYTVGTVLILLVGALTLSGKISPWTGRFYSLLDPSYAKNHIPIIASVSEHQPTSWSSFYFDLQILVFLFPAGLFFCFSQLTDANIFLILYGVTSIYFAVSLNYHIYTFSHTVQVVGCYGKTDVGFGARHVHIERHHGVSSAHEIS